MIIEKTYFDEGSFKKTITELDRDKVSVRIEDTDFPEYNKQIQVCVPCRKKREYAPVFLSNTLTIRSHTVVKEGDIIVANYFSTENGNGCFLVGVDCTLE